MATFIEKEWVWKSFSSSDHMVMKKIFVLDFSLNKLSILEEEQGLDDLILIIDKLVGR